MVVKKVPVEIDRLIFAYRDPSQDNIYYLDLETGEVRLVNRTLDDVKDLTDEIEIERNRFLYLPKPDRNQIKEDLKDFMKSIDNQEQLRVLEMAFESPHVYASFLKILEKDKEKLDELEDFIIGRTRIRVFKWLEANCIETNSLKTTKD